MERNDQLCMRGLECSCSQQLEEAGQAVKAATDLTNKLLVANAETLRTGNAEARRELERGTFDMDAIKQANAALVGTIEDSLRIADEARGQRAGRAAARR